ncbi:MAG: hypothetical protein JJU46_10525, partial [Balneolaceae bacterium]|nr:hypothetical protein [Balneolaceae bacterium]
SQFNDEKSEDHIPLEQVRFVEEIFQQFESEGFFQSLESEVAESKEDKGFDEDVERDEEDPLALTYNRLSHLLFVVQEEPNEALQIISENSFPQAIKRLAAKSERGVSSRVERDDRIAGSL